MAGQWDLSDELNLVDIFGRDSGGAEADGPPVEPTDEAGVRAVLKGGLEALSHEYWARASQLIQSRLLDPKADPGAEGFVSASAGKFAVISGIAAKKNTITDKQKTVGHKAGSRNWEIVVDEAGGAAFEALATARKEWGWPVQGKWDAVGTVKEVTSKQPRKKGAAAMHTVLVDLNGLYVQDQVAVFVHPKDGAQVPGLEAARAKLKEFLGEVMVISDPKAMLEHLLKSLADQDIEQFRKLWVPTTHWDAKRRFNHFLDAFETCGGKVSFDSFDPRNNPETASYTGRIRMYVTRQNADGSFRRSPLVLVPDGDGWRLKSGTF